MQGSHYPYLCLNNWDTVTGEIGFSLKSMFLNLTLSSRHTSPIIASGILNPALAYLSCSRALHVKCRHLPEDITSSPNIGAICYKVLSVVECYLLQSAVCCRILSVADFCLLQSAICCRVLSVAEYCLLQSSICCKVLSVAEHCL
jgi:hypothetical protein